MKRGLFLTVLFGLIFTATTFAQTPKMPELPTLDIVKFSDYQCPACKFYGQMVDQAKEDFGDRIKVTYKHYPLRIHQHAQLAARAAEAAKAQGKFDEMHEMLFAGQSQWSNGKAEAIFIGYAKSLDLDMSQFRKDLNSARLNRIVIADVREGSSLGVNSTPTFFMDGKKVERVPQSYPQFKALIQSKLKN